NKFNGILVVDEAYIDYSEEASFINSLDDYPNLVVLQTFSKAWGLAGLRLGMAFASKELVDILNKIKPPYNINQSTQELVMQALREKEKVDQSIEATLAGRAYLQKELQQLPVVEKIYPTDANFLLVKTQRAKDVYQYLLKCGIVVRDRSNVLLCNDCLRITVGTEEENASLIFSLQEYSAGNPPAINTVAANVAPASGWVNKRQLEHRRKTNETDIIINLNLDGEGKAEISTGLRFFDHMLEQVGRHGKMDLFISAKGDLDIDEHHTIEDTGIALGEAFAKVLVDKRGMERYGFALPMDDAEAKVLIDFGGRNWIVWEAEFSREKIGDMPTEMFFHFFKSFSDAARCNLNIEAKGDNEHHKIEAIFKAFAKAIRMAVKRDPFSNYLPSTKGVL
ncbi:MAG TPA: imidazoleglycerol-phosphate dehydratase HisB, partial [Chitinophagaceae bacterium]